MLSKAVKSMLLTSSFRRFSPNCNKRSRMRISRKTKYLSFKNSFQNRKITMLLIDRNQWTVRFLNLRKSFRNRVRLTKRTV